jgi:hypothetical protein
MNKDKVRARIDEIGIIPAVRLAGQKRGSHQNHRRQHKRQRIAGFHRVWGSLIVTAIKAHISGDR